MASEPAGASKVEELQTSVETLQARVTALEEELGIANGPEPIEQLASRRNTRREEAKRQIREFYARGETYYMSEVTDRLNLRDELVVELCTELRRKGELQVDDSALRSG